MAETHREEIAKLEALYAGNPGGRVFVHLAEAYRKAGEHERARHILDEGLARHTDSASGYVVLGRVLADMQITAEAETAFRRVLELDGGNLVALRWLGDLARQDGRGAEAVGFYRDLLARNPSNEEVRDLVDIVERELEDAASSPAPDEPAGPVLRLETSEEAVAAEPVDDVYGMLGIAAPSDAVADPEPGIEPIIHEPVSFDPGVGADLVASFDAIDNALELDEVSRDDEAEPAEIHLLDPSFEATAEEVEEDEGGVLDVAFDLSAMAAPADEELDDVMEVDLSEFAAVGEEERPGDYADDSFVADLANAAEESSPDAFDDDMLDQATPISLLGTESASPQVDAATDRIDDDIADLSQDILAGLSGVSEPAAEAAAPEPAPEPEPMEPEPEPMESGPAVLDAEPPPVPAPSRPAMAPAARDAGPGEVGLVTETMALLYRSQGFHERAAEVYRALLRQRPGDERLEARLRDAEQAASAAPVVDEPLVDEPVAAEEDETGDVWLRGVGSPWTVDTPDAVEEATPYAWTDTEEHEPGEPIGAYIQDLVSWKPGQAARSTGTPKPVAEPGTPAESADEAFDWMKTPSALPDVERELPEPAGDPWADAAVEELESWALSEPAPAEIMPAESTPVEEVPADPWLQAPLQAEQEQDTASLEEWTSPDLADATAEPAGGVPANASPAAPAMSQEDDDGDDEDLEMFRSWLQSLKK